MFKNNKGFSMVELLAVIVILGVVSTVGIAAVVRLVNYSRENYYKTQNKNLVMAAQAYANDERSILPKEMGGISKVYLKDLIEKKYIKEDILDQSKRKCDADLSYVSIIKKNRTDYNYVGYLNCPACVQKGNSDGYCQTASEEVPTASVSLSTGTLTIDGNQEEQIKMAEGALVMQGNADGTKELYSYSYKVYSNGVLKYNSGTKRIKGNSLSISINKVLSENVPGNIKVTLTVTNEDGYSKTVSNSKNYNDIVDPHCGAITGQPNTVTRGGNVVCADDSWTSGTRDIMITCNDFQGSGCKQREFSTHFTNESGPNGRDTIEIEDVSGKKTSCTVFPCIDKTPPSITVKVYKRVPSQTTASYYTNNATAIKEFTVSTNDTTVKDVGWFNKSYADGVFFVITSTDSGIIKSYKAQYNDYGKYGTVADNDTNIYKHNSSYNSNSVNSKEVTKTTYLDAEGRRYIKFTVVDGAGNVASMALRVEIDKTEPTVVVTAGRCSHRTDAECKADSFSGTTTSVTANQSATSRIINMKSFVSKGIKINYTITDNNSTTRIWETNNTYSMTAEGNIENGKSTSSDTAKTGTVSLAHAGKRQGVLTIKDAAGNTVKVTINGYVANTCTITYNSNYGTFNSNASNLTETVAYNSYFGDEANGLRNAKGGFYNATRDYHKIISSNAWTDGTNYYDESKRYLSQNVCSGMNSADDKAVTFKVNFIATTVTFKYHKNGGHLIGGFAQWCPQYASDPGCTYIGDSKYASICTGTGDECEDNIKAQYGYSTYEYVMDNYCIIHYNASGCRDGNSEDGLVYVDTKYPSDGMAAGLRDYRGWGGSIRMHKSGTNISGMTGVWYVGSKSGSTLAEDIPYSNVLKFLNDYAPGKANDVKSNDVTIDLYAKW